MRAEQRTNNRRRRHQPPTLGVGIMVVMVVVVAVIVVMVGRERMAERHLPRLILAVHVRGLPAPSAV